MSTVAEVLNGILLKSELPVAIASEPVAGLAYDSRNVEKGWVFFAFPGKHVDGGAFAQQALERGALAIVSESPQPADFGGPWLQVEHGRRALAIAARNFFDRPDERIGITGITGTNGKTTTTYIVDSILSVAGNTTGLLGTIEYRMAGKAVPAVNTTPESLESVPAFRGPGEGRR